MSAPKLIPELYVTSYKKSLDFYTNALGFKVLYAREQEYFAMLEREGVQIMIEELGHSRNWITAELTPPFGRGVNFQIETSNVQKLYETAQASDAPIFLELEEKWYDTDIGATGNKQFIVQDPDGYLLRFFEDLGVKKQ
jgi:catechol 2,3-dioxygenase-like lactoylglutathione lyase family enzyme